MPSAESELESRAACAPQRPPAPELPADEPAAAAPSRDRMRWAFVLGWSAVFAPYLGLLAGRAPSAAYRNAWAFVALAGLVVAACLIDLPRQARREERRFRLLVAAAFAVWAASELFEHLLAGLSAAARRGVGDVAFVVFGVLMSAAALVTSERGLSRSEVGLRRLHRAEVALFAGGVFVYLIVLPPRFDPALAASSVPSALLYLTLDLLMLGLFLWRRSRAPAAGARWTALAVAAALFLLSDALFLAVLGGRFDLERHALADLFWYLPHLAVIVAVRGTGRAASVGDGAPSAAGRVQLRIAPGFLYAALVPVVHLVAESASAATAAGGQAQRHFALALTLGLLLLAWAHQRRQRAVWDELRRELAAGARRRAAAAKLEAIGRLAAGVAHDFNNLLTVVVGRAELAQARLAAAGERRELDAILELSQRATALTSELLAVGEREPRVREAIAVDAFVESRRSRFEERAGGRVAVVLELDAAGGRIEVDPGHLDRMLDNLVANALDAMPSGGRLTLATRRQRLVAGWTRHLDEIAAGDYVTLEVRDEGVGMDAELLTRVFEPFFTTKDLGRSAGLGLATVRGLVRQNGGQVVAHSRPGAGTSFEIYFPETA